MEQYVVEAAAFDDLDSKERHWISPKPMIYNEAAAKRVLKTAVGRGLEFWTARMKFEADGIRLLSNKNMTDRIGFY